MRQRMSRGPSAKHFTSWLCLAPGNKISGGKILSSKTRLAAYKVPRIVTFVDDLPKTASGKILRRALRQ
ncbi:AMP-binding enzyme [Paraburkholderia sp. 40]|uniref:AMP-binding enzyme n=1 Tax=unclassified Paraburkholderia TaxID=2615204 RepID=UPI003D23DE50